MIFILAVLFSTTTFPFFKKIASVSALSLVVSASALGTKQPESKNTLSKRVRRTKHFRYDDHFIVFPNEKVFYQTQHAYYGGRLREIYEAYQGQEDKSSIDLGAGIDLTQEQWTRIGKRLNFRDFGLDIPNNIVLQKLFRNDLVAFDRFCYKRRIRRLRAFLYSVPYENPMDQKECWKLAWGKSMFDAVVGWYTGCF
jgi:hypothetical protein